MEKTKIKIRKLKIGLMIFAVLIVLIAMFNAYKATKTTERISYDKFLELLDENAVSKVVIMDDNLEIILKNNNKEYGRKILYTAKIDDYNLVSELRNADVTFTGRNKTESPIGNFIGSFVISIAIIYLLWKNILVKIASHNTIIEINDILHRIEDKSK